MKVVLFLFKRTSLCSMAAIVAIVFFACERNLNLDIKTNDKRLLLEGEFTNDSILHHIKLYHSGSLTTGQPQSTVSGAVIYITNQIDTFHYAECDTIPGFYQTISKCYGKGGDTYHLFITNIDLDGDGKVESYHSTQTMPVPVIYDSLVVTRELYYNEIAIINRAYYNIEYKGADYLYTYAMLNNAADYGTIGDRLGSGEYSRFEKEFKIPTITNPDTVIAGFSYHAIRKTGKTGDTISFIGYNFTKEQYKFLIEFDNSTTNGEIFTDNLYDQLRIPKNLPTNIEPSNKAAGYFFVCSVSNISKILE